MQAVPHDTLAAALTADRGFSVLAHVSLNWIEFATREIGWRSIENRPGVGPIDELTPRTRSAARPGSLSAKVGLDQQPLHTDGAHLVRPPDVVILHAAAPNSTPTQIVSLDSLTPTVSLADLDDGVFLVSNGLDSFFSTALSHENQVRFDPGCKHSGGMAKL